MFEWLIPALVFASVGLLIRRAGQAVVAADLRRKALAAVRPPEERAKRRRSPIVRWVVETLPVLAAWQQQWVPPVWAARTQRRLAALPGWEGRGAAQWLAVKEWGSLAGALAGLAAGGWFLPLALAAAGFLLPDLWLAEKDQARRRAILRELPNTLDLLASCMQAGMGFEPAVGVLLERRRPGTLDQELEQLMQGIRMGQARQDALQAMARRVDERDFSAWITALVQADRLGVSVAGALKQQAAAVREKRSQHIEKLALEAPVKLLFPLILFIFPVVFLILFGPILLRVFQVF